WSRDVVLSGCGLAGAEITLIIHVDAIGNGIKSPSAAESFHHGEQLILAVEATRGIIASIFGPVKFISGDDFNRDILFSSKSDSVLKMCTRQAGRISDHCEHFVAKNLIGGPGKKCRVDSARVSHQQTA